MGECEARAYPDCLGSANPSRNLLRITDSDDDEYDQLSWRWKGDATSAASIGDPLHVNGMSVCIFDESGPAPSLLLRADAPLQMYSWKSAGAGRFKYRHPVHAIRNVTLRAGANSSIVKMKGRGVELSQTPPMGFPSAPLALPIRVQVQMHHGGACFESVYDSAGIKDNSGGVFSAEAVE